jgi:Uma2 family endonuclease
MNTQFRSRFLPRTTQAAEGLMRRRWTTAEIEAMVDAGVILDDERFELIGGEVVPMSPKGDRHELLKISLTNFWVKRIPDDLRLAPETTFRLDEDTFLEPDFVFYRTSTGLVNLRPENALLTVELSDSSLGYDLGRKARLYASFGIRELWVMDAVKLVTHIHRRPGIEGYEEKTTASPDDLLTPSFAPQLAVALGSLTLV